MPFGMGSAGEDEENGGTAGKRENVDKRSSHATTQRQTNKFKTTILFLRMLQSDLHLAL
jgi:hypothetical protein